MIEYLSLRKITEMYEPQLEQAVLDVVKSGVYLYGKQVKAFEEEYAAFCGAKFCVGVANGLDALTLILEAYKHLEGWSGGGEGILLAETFFAKFLYDFVGIHRVFFVGKTTKDIPKNEQFYFVFVYV